MSKQVDGFWEHKMWCNYFMVDGPCKCCDNHPEWEYVSDLQKLDENKGLSPQVIVRNVMKRDFPNVIERT